MCCTLQLIEYGETFLHCKETYHYEDLLLRKVVVCPKSLVASAGKTKTWQEVFSKLNNLCRLRYDSKVSVNIRVHFIGIIVLLVSPFVELLMVNKIYKRRNPWKQNLVQKIST